MVLNRSFRLPGLLGYGLNGWENVPAFIVGVVGQDKKG